jgi:peptidoglycan/LPS O-acetylase OafA/YrhL
MEALTGIRAIAAFWVVLYHFKATTLEPLHLRSDFPALEYGYLGVDLFFLLSGFVMTHVHGRDFPPLRWPRLRVFYGLRLARLYPVHFVVLLFLAAAVMAGPLVGIVPKQPEQFTGSSFAVNLLLLQAWWDQPLTWNTPSWSISCEWFVYLLFPLFAIGLRRAGGRALWLWLAAELLLFAAAYAWVFGGDIDRNAGLALLRVAFEFSIGGLLCRLTQRWDLSSAPWTAIVAALVIGAELVPGFWHDFTLVLAFGCAVLAGRYPRPLLSRFLAVPALVYLGEISYSLYMVHVPVQLTAGKLFENLLQHHVHSYPAGLLVGLLAIACTVAVAAAMYHLVEWPARRWLRRRLAVPPVAPGDAAAGRGADPVRARGLGGAAPWAGP